MVFQKNQDVAATDRTQEKKELRSPNRGMIREETPVDKSQMNTIRLICSVEKIFVMEGSPALS